MVETFMSGFAQGFVNERNRRIDRENQEKDQTFKYKMDELTKMKELRNKKKLEETDWAKKAKDLSGQLGDNNSSSVFYRELQNGVSYETLQKRVLEGQYQKNPDWTQPTQTVKVPSAVEMTQDTTTPDPTASTTPAKTKIGEVLQKGKQIRHDKMASEVDAKIDNIDPTLRASANEVDDTKTITDGSSPYVLKPKNQYEIGDYKDVLYELSRAEQEGNPVKIADAKEKVRIHQMVLTEKAKADASAQGKNVKTYISVNPDGTIGAQFAGEQRGDGSLWNVSNPLASKEGGVQVTGAVREMSSDELKRYNSLVDQFGKDSSDYYTSSGSFIAAMDSSQRMAQILQSDPEVTTKAYNVLQIGASLEGEYKAAYEILVGKENEINSKIQSGDLTGIEKDILDYSKSVDQFYKDSIMSPGNQKKIVNKALYNSLQTAAAYQFAMASGQGKLSNQDFENNLARIGGNKTAPEVLEALRSTGQEAYLKLSSTQRMLDGNESVKQFERSMTIPGAPPIQTGLRGKRLGDQIVEMNIPDDQKQALIQYLNTIHGTQAQGQAKAAETATQSAKVPDNAVQELSKNPTPENKKFFDEVFGPGAADRVLGGK